MSNTYHNGIQFLEKINQHINKVSREGHKYVIDDLVHIFQYHHMYDLKKLGDIFRKVGSDFELVSNKYLKKLGYDKLSLSYTIIIKDHPQLENLVKKFNLGICYKNPNQIVKEIDGLYIKDGKLVIVEMKTSPSEAFIKSINLLLCLVYLLREMYRANLLDESFISSQNGTFKLKEFGRYLSEDNYQILLVTREIPVKINYDIFTHSFIRDFNQLKDGQKVNPTSYKIYRCFKKNKPLNCLDHIKDSFRYRKFIENLQVQDRRFKSILNLIKELKLHNSSLNVLYIPFDFLEENKFSYSGKFDIIERMK